MHHGGVETLSDVEIGIPALAIAMGIEVSWPRLALWVLGVCLLGIVLAVPLRR